MVFVAGSLDDFSGPPTPFALRMRWGVNRRSKII